MIKVGDNRVEEDYIIAYKSKLLCCAFFDRSRQKAKACGLYFGKNVVVLNYKAYLTEDNFSCFYKPVFMGYDRFIYAVAISHEVGESYIITTQDKLYENVYHLLMKTYKYPLLIEWMPELVKALINTNHLIQERNPVVCKNMDRLIQLNGTNVALKDIQLYKLEELQEELFEEILSDLLVRKKIWISKQDIPSLDIAEENSFNHYLNKYGKKLADNLDQQILPLTTLRGSVPSLALKNKRLYPPQAACVNGMTALIKSGAQYGFLCEGMGVGKTIQAASVVDAYFNQKYLQNNPGVTLREVYLSKAVKYRVFLLAPGHLLEKWKEEILAEIPDSKVVIVKDIAELIALRQQGKARRGREYYLLSKDFAKLGTVYSPIPSKVIAKKPTVNICLDCMRTDMDEDQKFIEVAVKPLSKKQLVNLKIHYQKGVGKDAVCECCNGKNFKSMYLEETAHKGLLCPHCGELLIKYSPKLIARDGEFEKYVLTPKDFSSRNSDNSVCYHCGEQLWGVNPKPLKATQKKSDWYKISHFRNHTKKTVSTAFVLKRYEADYLKTMVVDQYEVCDTQFGPRKTSPAQYVKTYLKGYSDILILDEVHKFEGHGSAQAVAAHAFMKISKFTLGLTGTISNGSADSFFSLLFMLDPRRMKSFGFEFNNKSILDFAKMYGCVETVYKVDENSTHKKSSRGKVFQQPRIKPGISPKLFIDFLLDRAVFLDLSDLSKHLPPLHEYIKLVKLPDMVQQSYSSTINTLKNAMSSPEGRGLLGAILQFGLSYPDKPYGRSAIISPFVKDTVIANIENFEEYEEMDELLPKEEVLVSIVSKEINEGRNCFVYCSYTGNSETNVTTRLQQIIETHCNLRGRVHILQATSPSAIKREQYIHQKANDGVKVFICNPKLVETGLDFCFEYKGKKFNYPTLIFYQMTYELSVLWQASRRAYRLSQTKECRTYWLAYENTLQSAALEIMAEKQVATSAIQGKFSTEGLAAMAKGVDAKVRLAQALAKGDQSNRESLENMFDALNKSNNEQEDLFEGQTDKVIGYYELMGEEEPVIIPEKVFENLIFSSFFTEQCQTILFSHEEDTKSIVKTKKLKKEAEGQMTFMDLF